MSLADDALVILKQRSGNPSAAHLSREGEAICDAVERRLKHRPSRAELRDTVTMISRAGLLAALKKAGRKK